MIGAYTVALNKEVSEEIMKLKSDNPFIGNGPVQTMS